MECIDCTEEILNVWDGEPGEGYICGRCDEHVCFDCRSMDTTGEDFCDSCAAEREKENPDAFVH